MGVSAQVSLFLQPNQSSLYTTQGSEKFGSLLIQNRSVPSKVRHWCFRTVPFVFITSVFRRMPFSGMLRRVALIRTDISEDCIDFIIRVKRMSELGITLVVTSNRSTLQSA
jgi:hypothetical protein